MSEREFYVYIMSNGSEVLYVGFTNNLLRRVNEHKNGLNEGFTKKYKVNRLVYYEATDDPSLGIFREKQIKRWNRQKKIDLIKTINPNVKDLSDDWD